MSPTLRILCVIGAAITFVTVISKVRHARIQIEDSIFWVLLSFTLLVLAVFPRMAYVLSELLGIRSPSNLVFLAIITVLLIKEFANTVEISQLKHRVRQLAQEEALASKSEDRTLPL